MSGAAEKKPPLDDRLALARARIDEINGKLLGLLGERAQIALEIGHLKRADGAGVYQPLREQQIIDGLLQNNPGPLTGDHIRRIFTEIISACRALEQELRVAYLGPEYSYTHLAAVNRFGSSAELIVGRIDRRGLRGARSARARPTSAWCRWKTPPRDRSP